MVTFCESPLHNMEKFKTTWGTGGLMWGSAGTATPWIEWLAKSVGERGMASFSRDKIDRKWDRIDDLVSLWTGGRKDFLGEGCFFCPVWSNQLVPFIAFLGLLNSSSPIHTSCLHSLIPSATLSTASQEAGSKQISPHPPPFPELHGTATCQPRFSPVKHIVLSLWSFLRVVKAAVTAACQNAQKVKKDTEGQDRHSQRSHASPEAQIEVPWGVRVKQAHLNLSSGKQNRIEKSLNSTLPCSVDPANEGMVRHRGSPGFSSYPQTAENEHKATEERVLAWSRWKSSASSLQKLCRTQQPSGLHCLCSLCSLHICV